MNLSEQRARVYQYGLTGNYFGGKEVTKRVEDDIIIKEIWDLSIKVKYI